MSFPLEGKSALVTRGTSGLGWDIAVALAGAGAHVVIQDDGEDSSRIAGDHAAGPVVVAGEISDPDAVATLVSRVESACGTVDILVNCQPPPLRRAFLEIEATTWEQLVGDSLDAAYLCAQGVLPGMAKTGSGRIINILGNEYFTPRTDRVAGAVFQAGLIGLSRALAKELGPQGITVNAIATGLFEGPRTARLPPRAVRSLVPAGRLGRAEDIGGLCVFLASTAGSYINGQTIHTNGGRVMA